MHYPTQGGARGTSMTLANTVSSTDDTGNCVSAAARRRSNPHHRCNRGCDAMRCEPATETPPTTLLLLSLSLSLSPPPPPLRPSIPSGAWHCPLAHPTVVSQSLPSWRACCRCLRRRPHSKTTCRRLRRLPRMISRRHRMMSWGCRRRQARSTIICPATYIYILGTISTISTTSHALLSSKPPSPHTHARARAHAVCHARRSRVGWSTPRMLRML